MIKALIVEDEHYISKGLHILIESLHKNIQIIGISPSVKDAIEKANRLKPNLVFLDIKLLDGTGFDFLEKTIHKKFKTIFITSYDEYAIQALKAGAIDYILKPIDINELDEAIDKVLKDTKKEETINLQNKIVLHFLSETQIVDLNKLLYCKSHKGYTTFFMENGKEYLTSKPLKEYEIILSENNFIRSHQSYFVNSNYIDKFDSKNKIIYLKNSTSIPVSARKVTTINLLLHKN